ncbi:DUF1467 family protein [Agrobacterium larrymoorei]|uniref:DUF1467 family protein n=1 Tax=Agrobacterium larrymoorei TaxID=160699 RepID=UPI001571A2F5|nr:DUF1467 family protein [Agrobacterium larrymoorei]NTJ42104.1 DUF1467 family protein [Agrobacterium larrymoorei]
MQWLSIFAIFFIVWWTVLFVVLPIGMRTQLEAGEVELGTEASAPVRFRGAKVVMMTTAISLLICGTWYATTWYFGVSMDDLPRIIPVYD